MLWQNNNVVNFQQAHKFFIDFLIYVFLHIFLSFYIFVFLSESLYFCIVRLSVFLSVLLISFIARLSVFLSIVLSVFLSKLYCVSVSLSIFLSVFSFGFVNTLVFDLCLPSVMFGTIKFLFVLKEKKSNFNNHVSFTF